MRSCGSREAIREGLGVRTVHACPLEVPSARPTTAALLDVTDVRRMKQNFGQPLRR